MLPKSYQDSLFPIPNSICGKRPKFCCFFPQLVCVVHKFHCDSNQVIWTLFGVFSVWGNSAYWGKKLLLYFREQTFLPFSRKLNKVNQEMNLLIFHHPFELKSLNEAVEHDLGLKWCLLSSPLAGQYCVVLTGRSDGQNSYSDYKTNIQINHG